MLRANEDLKEKTQTKKQVTCLKRRKTRVTKSLLVLVLIVIGWEGGAISLEQSQNEVKFLITLPVTLPQIYQKSKEKINGQQWFLKGCNRGTQQKITDLVDYCNFIETEFTSSMVKFTEKNDRPADPRHTSRG